MNLNLDEQIATASVSPIIRYKLSSLAEYFTDRSYTVLLAVFGASLPATIRIFSKLDAGHLLSQKDLKAYNYPLTTVILDVAFGELLFPHADVRHVLQVLSGEISDPEIAKATEYLTRRENLYPGVINTYTSRCMLICYDLFMALAKDVRREPTPEELAHIKEFERDSIVEQEKIIFANYEMLYSLCGHDDFYDAFEQGLEKKLAGKI